MDTQNKTDEARLKVLMVEFFRSSGLPFFVADSPQLQKLCQFLNPTIPRPSSSELLSMNVVDMHAFKILDKPPSEEHATLTRNQLIEKYAQLLAKKPECTAFAKPNKSVSKRSETKPKAQNETSPQLEKEIKKEPVDSEKEENSTAPNLPPKIRAKILKKEKKIAAVKSIISRSKTKKTAQETELPLTSEPFVPMPEDGKVPTEEKKPNFEPIETPSVTVAFDPVTQRCSLKRATTDSVPETESASGQAVKLPKIETEEEWEDEFCSRAESSKAEEPQSTSSETMSADTLVRVPVTNKRSHSKANSLITFKQAPGVVRYPCVVCQARMEPTKVRAVTNNDAYIMIYLCYMNGLYSIEKAKETACMQKFKVCVNHLTGLYDSALHHFKISDPDTDVSTNNDSIANAFRTVKMIKGSRYSQQLVCETSKKHMVPFCISIMKYLDKYSRQNYVQSGGPS